MLSPKRCLKLSLCLVFLFLLSFFITACTYAPPTSLPAVIKSFNCDLCVICKGREYVCELKRENDISVLKVKQPAELDGLEIEYTQGIYSVSFKGLKMSIDDSEAQLTRHFADGLMKMMDKTFSLEEISAFEDNGVWLYEGETAYGGFEVRFDKEGKILSAEIPSVDAKITFENFEELQ